MIIANFNKTYMKIAVLLTIVLITICQEDLQNYLSF